MSSLVQSPTKALLAALVLVGFFIHCSPDNCNHLVLVCAFDYEGGYTLLWKAGSKTGMAV